MKVGSLFAGVGGFDLAAERADMDIIWQSENDKHASETLAEHFPDIPNYGDIHDISKPPAVDVLVGGFPCQDYSIAGQRSGLAGDRGALWWEFHRLINEVRPTWVVGENVPGLLSSRGGQDFATIIDSLTECGYRVAWRVLDAQYFGVAQRRRRVFIVGSLGEGSPSEVLALAEGMSGHPKPLRAPGQEVAERASGGTGTGGGTPLLADTGIVRTITERYGKGGTDLTDAEGGHVVVGPLTAGMHKGPRGTEAVESNHIMPVSGPLGANSGGHRYDLDTSGAYIPFAQNTRDEVRIVDEENGAQIVGALAAEAGMKQQTYLMRQREGKPGGGKGPLVSEDKSLTLAANVNDQVLFTPQAYSVYPASGQGADLQASETEISTTLSATDGSLHDRGTRIAENMQVRRLTPTECERLQGFPDGWTASQSDTQRYRQMGNAVAVPVVEWVMKRIAMVDSA